MRTGNQERRLSGDEKKEEVCRCFTVADMFLFIVTMEDEESDKDC